METIRQIEAAAALLPADEQRELLAWLEQRIGETRQSHKAQSVLDIPVVNIGKILMLEMQIDDVLGEMLEDRN